MNTLVVPAVDIFADDPFTPLLGNAVQETTRGASIPVTVFPGVRVQPDRRLPTRLYTSNDFSYNRLIDAGFARLASPSGRTLYTRVEPFLVDNDQLDFIDHIVVLDPTVFSSLYGFDGPAASSRLQPVQVPSPLGVTVTRLEGEPYAPNTNLSVLDENAAFLEQSIQPDIAAFNTLWLGQIVPLPQRNALYTITSITTENGPTNVAAAQPFDHDGIVLTTSMRRFHSTCCSRRFNSCVPLRMLEGEQNVVDFLIL